MNFFKSMLSDGEGSISSKRVVMFLLTITFIGLTIANFVTGKNLDDTFKQQLFYLVIWALTMVFGEQLTGILDKQKKPDITNGEKDK